MKLLRYPRLYGAFVRNCLMRAMEYRAQFLMSAAVWNIWAGSSLLVVTIVFERAGVVRGWSRWDMYALYGTYVLFENCVYGTLGPNMWRFSSYVREGTLDLALTRPVNVQFFASARYVDTNAVANLPIGFGALFVGLSHQPHWPAGAEVMAWAATLACGYLIAYAIWFMIVTNAVWAVKLDAAGAAFEPFFQLAKFPLDLYPQRWRTMLTFALPVAYFSTFPVQFLLGRGNPWWLLTGALTAGVFVTLSSKFWNFALLHYGSASS